MQQSLLILLAEDDALIAMSLQDALEEACFAVHHDSDAAQAIEALEARHGEMSGVVTDINFGLSISSRGIVASPLMRESQKERDGS